MKAKFSWDWANEILYCMCRKNPHHRNLDVIVGKMCLIGRAYAASIERGAGGEDVYATIAPNIEASELDSWLEDIADLKSVNLENLHRVLAAHCRLTALLKTHTNLERRSFASKYLHFHKPNAFFIFDSRADREIRQRVARRRVALPRSCKEADQAYATFVLRCIEYRDHEAAEPDGISMSPRQLDKELLGYH